MRFRKSYIDYKGRKTYDYGNEGYTTVGGTVIYGSSSSSTPSTKPQSSPQSPVVSSTTINNINNTTTVVSLTAYETNTGDTPGHWTAEVDGLTHIADGTLVSLRISTACFSNSEGYNTLNINDTGAKMVWFDYGKPLKQELATNDEVLLVYREDAGRYTLPNPNPGGLSSDVFPSDGTVRSGWIIVSSDDAAKAGDMKNYYTRDEVDTLISEALARTISSGQVMTLIENYLEDNNYIHYELISPSDYENLTNPDPNTLYITGIGNYLGGINMCCGGGGGGGDTPYYNVSPLTIHDEGSGGTYTITVMSNTGYTLQSSDNWFTFSPQSGYGYGEFSVVIPSGDTYRAGSIVIGDKTVSVTQGDAALAEYLTFINRGNSPGILSAKTTGTIYKTLYFSVDGGDWIKYSGTNASANKIPAGGSVRLKSASLDNTTGTTNDNIILSGVSYDIYGNIMSLIYGDDFQGNNSIPSNKRRDYTFQGIFDSQFSAMNGVYPSLVVSAEGLRLPPPSEIGYGCFTAMFSRCTRLATPPPLPATTLSDFCYWNMFYNCTSLTSAPALPATTLATNCYQEMFKACTNLINAPELPATTLAEHCYRDMFRGCTRLVAAPVLPATSLADYCYHSMFSGCTSLTSAPALPATSTTVACYESMFSDCRKLASAPALPATTVAASCYDHMFSGCTSLTAAPALPAAAVSMECYSHMFYGCTGITAAPALPATALAENCYWNMFYNCTSLNSVICLGEANGNYYGTYNWLHNVSSTGTFTRRAGTNWLSGENGIPNNWTIVDAT